MLFDIVYHIFYHQLPLPSAATAISCHCHQLPLPSAATAISCHCIITLSL